MKRFNNQRNTRHGDKPKTNSLILLEQRCHCQKVPNEKETIKTNFKECLKLINKETKETKHNLPNK